MKKFKLSVISVALLTIGLPAQAATELLSKEVTVATQDYRAGGEIKEGDVSTQGNRLLRPIREGEVSTEGNRLLRPIREGEVSTQGNRSLRPIREGEVSSEGNKSTKFYLIQGALQQGTKSLNIALNDQLNVEFNKTKASRSKSGGTIWQGEVSAEFLNLYSNSDALSKQQNSAILVERDGTVTGTVRYEGKLYRIRSQGSGVHSVEQINENNMQDHADDYIDPQTGTFDVSPQIVDLAVNPVLDVLVVYTSSAASQAGNIASLIDLAEAETNIGYSTSGVNTSVNVVHTAQVNYTEHRRNSEMDLSRLAGTSDGYMDEVHDLRDAYGADMVVLVSDVNGYCGQADAIYANAASAFAIVDFDCATGYYSFGHELGHLQGARHDPLNDPTISPFSYGHGYQDPSQNWRTVMAYNCSSNCTRQLFWSNPDKTYNGTATGTSSSSDNARVLNNTAATMAAFRAAADSEWTTVTYSGLSASTDDWINYEQVIPVGVSQLVVDITGGSGDADLYVHDSMPTTGSYTCRPWLNGNTETCTVDVSSGGTWHIALHAYSTFSDTSITWKYK